MRGKKFLRTENPPPPPPNHFSNGPSLTSHDLIPCEIPYKMCI